MQHQKPKFPYLKATKNSSFFTMRDIHVILWCARGSDDMNMESKYRSERPRRQEKVDMTRTGQLKQSRKELWKNQRENEFH